MPPTQPTAHIRNN